jgi:hypothetical protein
MKHLEKKIEKCSRVDKILGRGWGKTGMAQRLARGAHNSEVTGSKPVAGI